MIDEHIRAQLAAAAQTHGPEIIDRMIALVEERAKSFPDRERQVQWTFSFGADGRVTLEVNP